MAWLALKVRFEACELVDGARKGKLGGKERLATSS